LPPTERLEIPPRDALGDPPAARAGDLLPREIDGAPVVGATVDHRALRLDALVPEGAVIEPLTTRTWEGREIFRRSAGLALLEAAHRIGVALRLGPSITSGRLVALACGATRDGLASELHAALARVVADDVPFREEIWPVEHATRLFASRGWDDAAALLEYRLEPTVPLVSCGELHAISPGPTLPRTGALGGLEIVPHSQGFLLDFGPSIRRELARRPVSTRVLEARAPRFGGEMTRSEAEWLGKLGVTSVGAFDRLCVTGGVQELVQVSEGFHEKRIAAIADRVGALSDVAIIAVAGPSASGKTTFIKSLKVQLEVVGLHPVELSLDDYYLSRDRLVPDAAGEHDLEALEALDLELLDEHTTRLLAGQAVKTARYDFRTRTSAREGGPELRLGPGRVLLVEGIHALNPRLFGGHAERVFRVFIHPATTLPFDRLTSFEPADVRLLRRIVRDRHQRGYLAAENLARWSSVRRGERLHIYPFQANADSVFDSALVYEIGVLRVYAERYLLEVPRTAPELAAARRLRRLIEPFVPIDADHVPPTSILREFIGRSGFSYG
jgi:uridine kinase